MQAGGVRGGPTHGGRVPCDHPALLNLAGRRRSGAGASGGRSKLVRDLGALTGGAPSAFIYPRDRGGASWREERLCLLRPTHHDAHPSSRLASALDFDGARTGLRKDVGRIEPAPRRALVGRIIVSFSVALTRRGCLHGQDTLRCVVGFWGKRAAGQLRFRRVGSWQVYAELVLPKFPPTRNLYLTVVAECHLNVRALRISHSGQGACWAHRNPVLTPIAILISHPSQTWGGT
ncbi:hypothetical protein C8Q77DRAFT_433574 [Trametes polyzona]|nr:hypothetical protein C8Q77DRAFT_433574 [Trametes polyzona]